MEPLSIGLALSVASKSYSMITKTIEAGAEFEQVMGHMGKWWGACQDINKANEVAKKPPLFKKLTFQDSQKEALDAFVAKKLWLKEKKIEFEKFQKTMTSMYF